MSPLSPSCRLLGSTSRKPGWTKAGPSGPGSLLLHDFFVDQPAVGAGGKRNTLILLHGVEVHLIVQGNPGYLIHHGQVLHHRLGNLGIWASCT